MAIAGVALIIIAVAFCVLVLALIPTLLTVKRTAASLGLLSEMIQQELKLTLQELTAVLAEQKTVVRGVAEHTEDVARFMTALGETGNNLHTINRAVGTVTGVFSTSAVWATGVKVAGKYMLERYLKKRGGI
jgi:uncharacterized protein YoxC